MLWKPNFPHICNQNVVKTLFCLIGGGGGDIGAVNTATQQKKEIPHHCKKLIL